MDWVEALSSTQLGASTQIPNVLDRAQGTQASAAAHHHEELQYRVILAGHLPF